MLTRWSIRNGGHIDLTMMNVEFVQPREVKRNLLPSFRLDAAFRRSWLHRDRFGKRGIVVIKRAAEEGG